MIYSVEIPDAWHPELEPMQLAAFDSKKDAINFAREELGADSRGMLNVIVHAKDGLYWVQLPNLLSPNFPAPIADFRNKGAASRFVIKELGGSDGKIPVVFELDE